MVGRTGDAYPVSPAVATPLVLGVYTISLVFCCYQQVYDMFNTSCLGVILQVRGRDSMSTLQNGAAAYSVSRITYLPGWFPVAFPAVFVFLNVPIRPP